MKTAEEYVSSLRNRNVRVFMRGERIREPTDHPMVAPSIRTVAESYRLAHDPTYRDVFVAHSRFIDGPVNRFTHIFETRQDLEHKQTMQRILGRVTGTCFQRCVGMDALNAMYNVSFEMDQKSGETRYHERLVDYLKHVQREDLVVCGAMTDAKGDRSKGPLEQPDMFMRVVKRERDFIVVRGAKLHLTGVLNSHEILVMPGRSLRPEERDFAVSFAIPLDAPGLTLVYGRQPSDDRRKGSALDQGNPTYGGQEAIVLFDDVKVPMDRVFMLGETEWVNPLVEYFAGHHRHSYGGCKPGNGDVLIGATALLAKIQGVTGASHVRDKLVEMVQLNETMYACGVSAAAKATQTPAGTYMVDPLLANVCKQNVTRAPYEIGRLAEDLAGGLMATLPAEEDIQHPEIGPVLQRYLSAAKGTAIDRAKALRLIESMTLGTTCVPLRTEAMHGAGSPQAQRIRIAAQADFDQKMDWAQRIIGTDVE